MREFHVLNLGAGVQSTTLYLMYMRGLFEPQLDCAVFADTQDEPEAVYRHLEWLQGLNGPPIMVRTRGRLSEHLKNGVNSTGGRFASIPAFTAAEGEEPGKVRRQCSMEYKVEVIERTIRREIVGLAPRQRFPKDVRVHQYYGISLDEGGRALRIRERAQEHKWITAHFPLIENFMTRPNCKGWLAANGNVPHEVPRSACVYCPFHSDAEWLSVKANPRDWALAVEVDEALRREGNVVNRNIDQKMYLHRSCIPLVQIEFNPASSERERQLSMNFTPDCLGVCGN